MPETALILAKNSSHNVPAAIEAAKTHLTDLATLYLITEVAGQSQATLDAKRRDPDRFLACYHHLYGHDHPEEPTPEPEAHWNGLTSLEELRLLNAAQTLRVRPCPGTKQGLRNNALLAVPLGSGLRISEVLQLDRAQYTDKGFAHSFALYAAECRAWSGSW